MRTYENYVIIPQSYIIPSFQVRKGATPLTPTKPLGRFWLKRQKKNNPYGNLPPKHQTNFTQ
jgi:hypothetical protein